MPDKSTLTGDLRRGEETQVLLQLQLAGVHPEDYVAIGTNQQVCGEVTAVLEKHRLFTSPEQQVARLLQINEQIWKDPTITEERIKKDLREKNKTPRRFHSREEKWWSPEWPLSHQDALYAVTLFWETGDPLLTFFRNIQAYLLLEHSGLGRLLGYEASTVDEVQEWIEFYPKAALRPEGARWEVVELGRSYNSVGMLELAHLSLLDKPNPKQVGQELPALAVMHPEWVKTIGWGTSPYVVASELLCRKRQNGSIGIRGSYSATFHSLDVFEGPFTQAGIAWFL